MNNIDPNIDIISSLPLMLVTASVCNGCKANINADRNGIEKYHFALFCVENSFVKTRYTIQIRSK